MYDDALMTFLTTIPYFVCKTIVSYDLSAAKLEDTKHFLLGEVRRLGKINKKVRYEDINKSLHYSKAVVSKQLKKLEESDYIIMYDDEENKNRKIVEITEKGFLYTKGWLNILKVSETDFFKGISEEEKIKLSEYLRKFYNNLPQADYVFVDKENVWLEIFHCFVIIYRYTQHFYRTAVDVDGHFIHELRVLAHLGNLKNWVDFKKLEELLNLNQPKVVRLISSLYSKGFVNVRINPADQRKKQALIKEDGYEKAREIVDFYNIVKEKGLDNFTEDQRIEFYTILSKWEKNVNVIVKSQN
ncbi:MAG: MarR family transcriptional regulator [Treponema sp.]|nr:MarR family transcriptional regulator [Treponema sp.]